MSDYKSCKVCGGSGLAFSKYVEQQCTACCGAGGIAEPNIECYQTFDCSNGDHADCCPMNGKEPTYTMQQAIDKIVDGLALGWDGRTERIAAKTVFGEYVVYLAGTVSHGQWWSWHLEPVGGDYIANGEIDASDDNGRLKALSDCLDDYRKRLRAEIEKAVKL